MSVEKGMEVGSPENGFEEISNLLKDDESTLPEDLDLSFIMSKDISVDYAYDDSASNDKFNFHFNEHGQSELLSLLSNMGCYDIPGPYIDKFDSSAHDRCFKESMLDKHVDDQKLHIEPRRDQYQLDAHKSCGGYVGDSTFKMDAENVDHEILKDVCTQPQGFVSVQDNVLEGEIIDRPHTTPHIVMGEKTILEALEQELNQAEFPYNEEEENEVSVERVQKLCCSSFHRGDLRSKSENDNDVRDSPDASRVVDFAHIDQHDKGRTSQIYVSPVTNGEISVSPETSLFPHSLTDHGLSASNGYNDFCNPKASPDEIYGQSECCAQNGDTPSMDHSLHTGGQKSASSQGSGQRSQHMEGSSGKHVAATGNHRKKRSRSLSPRQRNHSSRCKKDCYTNSWARSQYSGDSHKRSSDKVTSFHPSPVSQNTSVSQGHKKLSYAYRSHKRKHDWAGSSDRGREVTCKDHLLDSGCQKSSCQHEPQERFLNGSSSKHAPASTENHHSQHNHKKGFRSISPSPVQRRDLCSGYKREHNKSRPRSPYRRDRKRYSPRHLLPPQRCFSRYRSHHIRCLSPASSRRTRLGKPGTCLFVAGFGFLTAERELERKFSRFGNVRNVRIIRDKRSGISRGYGFVSLERDEEADAAIRALHRTEWNGRVVLVEKSISK